MATALDTEAREAAAAAYNASATGKRTYVQRIFSEIAPRYDLLNRLLSLGIDRRWRRVALELWRGAAFREERYAAIALTDLGAYAPYRTMAAMSLFEEMIVTGAWWDYVDAIATHQLGEVLRAEPRPMSQLMRRWSRVGNMWKRRASILCQIRFKKDTDLDLLYACIEPNMAEAHYNLAIAFFNQGRHDEAIMEAETARALAPGDAQARSLLEHLRQSGG